VRLSVVEIYCERIRDLLDPSRDNLQVKQDAAGAIFIEGAGGSQCVLRACPLTGSDGLDASGSATTQHVAGLTVCLVHSAAGAMRACCVCGPRRRCGGGAGVW
jgi:hypothetical protein